MFFRKEGNDLLFLWKTDFINTWELNERGKLPYAIITLMQRGKNKYIIQSNLKMPKLKGKKATEYNKSMSAETEEDALKIAEGQRKHIDGLLKGVMGSDFVLQVLPLQAAIDYSIKGISTCIGCGKKYKSSKKYHRYCPRLLASFREEGLNPTRIRYLIIIVN